MQLSNLVVSASLTKPHADGALDSDALPDQAAGTGPGHCPASGALLLAEWILHQRRLRLCQLLPEGQARLGAGTVAAAYLRHGLLCGLGVRE